MTRKNAPTTPALAYSYIRFSTPQQAQGDSLRRQTEAAQDWCARNGINLDTSTTLQDLGRSAYTGKHRENADRHALAAFLKLVEGNKVPRGSYLIVENLDRLSREHIRPALSLLLSLIEAGVRVVQLKPTEMVYDEQVEPMALMMAIMELSRGNSESRVKSERIGGAWAEKKRRAAEDGGPVTKRVPLWLRVENGQIVVDEARAAALRRIYGLATQGYGIEGIAKRLNAEGVPPFGKARIWIRSYLFKLLTNRAVVGEYQPHTRRGGGKRRPDGSPIPGYFPAVITEEQWHAARGALQGRRLRGGRPPKELVNLFTGLLHDARHGGHLTRINKGKNRERVGDGYLLQPYRVANGAKEPADVSFPALAFERAILSCLREVDPRAVLPADDAADRVLALAGKAGALRSRVEEVKLQLIEGGDSAALADVLRTVEKQWEAAEGELAEARRQAASPLSAAWGECHTLLGALDAAPDQNEARLRLRTALRSIVAEVWCLFLARASWRIAAVQVWFAGGEHRDYLIVHRNGFRTAAASRQSETHVRSLALPGLPGEMDLRNPDHARELEAALSTVDIDGIG